MYVSLCVALWEVCSVCHHGHNIFLQVLGFFSNQSATGLIPANNFDVFLQLIGSTQEPWTWSSQQKVLHCFKTYISLCLNGAIGCGLAGTSTWYYGLQVFEPAVHSPRERMPIGKLPWHACALTELRVSSNSYDEPKIADCCMMYRHCHIYLNGQCLNFSEKRETIHIHSGRTVINI